MATITSKKQLTLPAALFRKAGLREGQKVVIEEEGGRLVITPAAMLVEELAGSLSLPKAWEGKSIDTIIVDAKRKYFREKR